MHPCDRLPYNEAIRVMRPASSAGCTLGEDRCPVQSAYIPSAGATAVVQMQM